MMPCHAGQTVIGGCGIPSRPRNLLSIMLEADQDRQRWFAAVAALVCLGITGFAVIQIFAEITRTPTPAEWSQARARELAGRWHSIPAGIIFPDRLGYSPDLGGD